jgi:hypothetical protein
MRPDRDEVEVASNLVAKLANSFGIDDLPVR